MQFESLILPFTGAIVLAAFIAWRQTKKGYTFVKTFVSALIGLIGLVGLVVGFLGR